jgi:D-glycero-D-manno-heptose 1,7-bisphosphate phosphatase
MPHNPTTGMKCVPVLYCDIDGTIRLGKDELGRFVNTFEDVVIFDGVEDLLWKYRALGWRIVGISNQAGIGLGYMSPQACSEAMHHTNRKTKYAFDRILWCEHRPDEGCKCRKPQPGLIAEARAALTKDHMEIYPSEKALFVGDRPEDQECANNAGIRFMWAHEWREGKHLDEITRTNV